MALINRKTYKKIEYYLYNYNEIKKEIEQYKEDIALGGGREYGEVGGGQSYHSDPTAIKAIKLTSKRITEDEKWLKIVEQTIRKFKGTTKGILINLKYGKSYGEVKICRELNIERATYYNWRQEIVTYAAFVAAQEGLIKVA
jgi:RinA family phage transcriptional activator